MRTRMTALVAVAAALACSSPTGAPSAPASMDADAINARYGELERALGSAAWESFTAAGPLFAAAGPVTAALRVDGSANAAIPRIPPALRGVTFVLVPNPLRYVPDPNRNDAPPNGLRIVLYAVNPITRTPEPGAPIGYADLRDEGDALPTGIALRLEIVSAGRTWIDYRVGADGNDTEGMVTATGFVSDPETRVEFDIDATGVRDQDSERMNLDFDIGIPVHAFRAIAAVENVHGPSGNTGQLDMDLMVGQTAIGVDAASTGDVGEAAVTVNEQLFATIGPDGVQGADGEPLSQEEMEALGHILALNGLAFDLFAHLMEPVGPILGLDIVPLR